MRVSLVDELAVERAGYTVERWGSHGWTLLDVDGAPLMIGNHGCCAPRKADAIGEALERIAAEVPRAA